MHFKKHYLVLVLSLFWISISSAQNNTRISVDFRVGETAIDPEFSNNAKRISDIILFLQTSFADNKMMVTSVEFSGMASPEGKTNLNYNLSQKRMQMLEQYIRTHVDIPDSLVTHRDRRISWEYLDSLVSNSDMPYRNEVSHIIRNTPIIIYKEGKIVDGRKKQLMDLNYGRTWHEMDRRFFQAMRNACAVVVTCKTMKPKVQEPIIEDEVETTQTPIESEISDTTIVYKPLLEEQSTFETDDRSFYMAVKTNLLMDVVAIPNLGLEVYLGKKWSVAANWHYAWWKNDNKSKYLRTYGGDITLRKWFGSKANEKPFTGHHIGLYGQILTYDIATGSRGYLGDKWTYGGGVEYGYSLPVAKRLNIDFTLGLGYLSGEYEKYKPIDECYVWQATKNRNWFGPTKAEISLVWLLGRTNINKRR